jgi:hypothetical protein
MCFQFEEYICAALAAIRYRDFIVKGEGSGVLISGGTGLASPWEGTVYPTHAAGKLRCGIFQISTQHGFTSSSPRTFTKFGKE